MSALITRNEPVQIYVERQMCACSPDGSSLTLTHKIAPNYAPAQYFYACPKCHATFVLDKKATKIVCKDTKGETICEL